MASSSTTTALAVSGGLEADAAWAFNPAHRMGVAYPNQRLASRFGGNFAGRGNVASRGSFANRGNFGSRFQTSQAPSAGEVEPSEWFQKFRGPTVSYRTSPSGSSAYRSAPLTVGSSAYRSAPSYGGSSAYRSAPSSGGQLQRSAHDARYRPSPSSGGGYRSAPSASGGSSFHARRQAAVFTAVAEAAAPTAAVVAGKGSAT